MAPSSRVVLRAAPLTVALTAVLAAFLAFATPAGAELADEAVKGHDGVENRDNVGVDDDRELVRAIEFVGDRVFVGGFFLDTEDIQTGQENSQPYLAAFDRFTGERIMDFKPQLNGPVLELDVSPDGTRLFVGGDFTSINGDNRAAGLAALDPMTGQVQTDWRATVEWDNALGQLSVDALAVDDGWVYVGGNISHITDTSDRRLTRYRLARLSVNTGRLDGWRPIASGGRVSTIAIDSDRNRAYLGGQFESINNIGNTYRFATVNLTDGALDSNVRQGLRIDDQLYPIGCRPGSCTWTQYYETARTDHFPYDIVAFDGYVSWVGDMAISVLRESDLDSVWSWSRRSTLNDDCPPDGDIQAAIYYDGYLYFGGHMEQMGTYYRADCATGRPDALGRWDPRTESWDKNFRRDFAPNPATIWELTIDPAQNLWIGGEFRTIGGTRVRNVAKMTSDSSDLSRPSTPAGLKATNAATGVELTWNPAIDNVGVTGYQIYRSTNPADLGTLIATTSDSPWTDTGALAGQPQTYSIKATDGAGNLSWRSNQSTITHTAIVAAAPARPATCTATNAGTAATITWAASANAAKYRVTRSVNGSNAFWRGSPTGTTFDDTLRESGVQSFVHAYVVEAVGADGSKSAPRACSPSLNPADGADAVSPPANCVASNAGTAATISWNASPGATDYRVYRTIDGGGPFWRGKVGATTFDDTLRGSGIHSYTVQARGANAQWSDHAPCAPDLDPADGLVQAGGPATCSASNNGTAATITWAAVPNAEYRVYRSVNGGNPFWRAKTTTTTFDDTLRAAGSHEYSVQARVTGGTWSPSTVCAPAVDPAAGGGVTPPPPPPAGGAPASCTAVKVGTDAVVTWDAVAGAVEYRVFRSIDAGNVWFRTKTSATTLTEGLGWGTHTYSVKAVDANGKYSDATTCSPDLVR